MRHLTSLTVKILVILAFIFSTGLSDGLSAEHQNGNEKIKPPANPEGSPRIQFDELSHDLGEVFQEKKLEHIFTFKNTGTGNLNIIKVKAG